MTHITSSVPLIENSTELAILCRGPIPLKYIDRIKKMLTAIL
jgi:hypothetical protein